MKYDVIKLLNDNAKLKRDYSDSNYGKYIYKAELMKDHIILVNRLGTYKFILQTVNDIMDFYECYSINQSNNKRYITNVSLLKGYSFEYILRHDLYSLVQTFYLRKNINNVKFLSNCNLDKIKSKMILCGATYIMQQGYSLDILLRKDTLYLLCDTTISISEGFEKDFEIDFGIKPSIIDMKCCGI